jgi:haloacetate dehalogenase
MDMSDLFPGFTARTVDTTGGRIFVRIGGSGPPLLLLHGYPESHMAWHGVAPALSAHFTVIAADLRGYGRSACPATDLEHRPYSKRAMAVEMIEVMAALGFPVFAVMGHDRGARVAYRMALDRPDVVQALVLVDVLTTLDQWAAIEAKTSRPMLHWPFLAQPAPIPESLIGSDPGGWVEGRLKRASLAQSLSAFHPVALGDYRRALTEPDRLHATCEDHRAGARIDIDHDREDRTAGWRIACPTLVVMAESGIVTRVDDAIAAWHSWCMDLTCARVASGHFIPEENPQELLAHVLPFLRDQRAS